MTTDDQEMRDSFKRYMGTVSPKAGKNEVTLKLPEAIPDVSIYVNNDLTMALRGAADGEEDRDDQGGILNIRVGWNPGTEEWIVAIFREPYTNIQASPTF